MSSEITPKPKKEKRWRGNRPYQHGSRAEILPNWWIYDLEYSLGDGFTLFKIVWQEKPRLGRANIRVAWNGLEFKETIDLLYLRENLPELYRAAQVYCLGHYTRSRSVAK